MNKNTKTRKIRAEGLCRSSQQLILCTSSLPLSLTTLQNNFTGTVPFLSIHRNHLSFKTKIICVFGKWLPVHRPKIKTAPAGMLRDSPSRASMNTSSSQGPTDSGTALHPPLGVSFVPSLF